MVAKIYAAETPVLEMGSILKNKLSPQQGLKDILSLFWIRMMAYGCVKAKWCVHCTGNVGVLSSSWVWLFSLRKYRIIYFAYLLKVNDIHSQVTTVGCTVYGVRGVVGVCGLGYLLVGVSYILSNAQKSAINILANLDEI